MASAEVGHALDSLEAEAGYVPGALGSLEAGVVARDMSTRLAATSPQHASVGALGNGSFAKSCKHAKFHLLLHLYLAPPA